MPHGRAPPGWRRGPARRAARRRGRRRRPPATVPPCARRAAAPRDRPGRGRRGGDRRGPRARRAEPPSPPARHRRTAAAIRRQHAIRHRVGLGAAPELQQRVDLRVQGVHGTRILGPGGPRPLRGRDGGRPFAAPDRRPRRQGMRQGRRRVRRGDGGQRAGHDRRQRIRRDLEDDHRRADVERLRAGELDDVLRAPARRPRRRARVPAPAATSRCRRGRARTTGVRRDRRRPRRTARRGTPPRARATPPARRARPRGRAAGPGRRPRYVRRGAGRDGGRASDCRLDRRDDWGRPGGRVVEARQRLSPVAERAVWIAIDGAIERRTRGSAARTRSQAAPRSTSAAASGRHEADIGQGDGGGRAAYRCDRAPAADVSTAADIAADAATAAIAAARPITVGRRSSRR